MIDHNTGRRSKIQEEIENLRMTRDAVHRLVNGIHQMGTSVMEIGGAIGDLMMVDITSRTAAWQSELELQTERKPTVEQLMQATENLQQAEMMLAHMQDTLHKIPEEYRGIFEMMIPMMEMQLQSKRDHVRYLQEELGSDQPLPDISSVEEDAGDDPPTV